MHIDCIPQYYTSGFGEIFPWRKFPAIRYFAHFVITFLLHAAYFAKARPTMPCISLVRKLFETLLGRAGASPPLVVRMAILCVRTYVRTSVLHGPTYRKCATVPISTACPQNYHEHVHAVHGVCVFVRLSQTRACSSWRLCL